jgi:hypothetical protein
MRKQIIIASIILFFVLLIVVLISRPKKPQENTLQTVTPTTVPIDIQLNEQEVNKALPYTPYEDENFSFDYSPEFDKLIVKEKTPQGREKFNEWANNNNLTDLAANPEFIVFENKATGNYDKDKFLDFDPVNELFNLFLNLGQGVETTSTNNQNARNNNSQTSNKSQSEKNQSSLPSGKYIYYAQCDSEYADLPLPDGCNMCQAGCGAATASMIASSYLGNNFNPKTIVNMYKSRGYLLSCAGSRYADARSLLQSLGLKTTDYIVFDYGQADQVAGILKKYLSSGWTFFTLANFKQGGGGHYFWITEIDNKGNIWAYDPYYGRFQAPPYNENSRDPFPQYRLAFGVKK